MGTGPGLGPYGLDDGTLDWSDAWSRCFVHDIFYKEVIQSHY